MSKIAKPSDTIVLVAGHGSSSTPETADSVHEHVANLTARGRFRHVASGFLKQAPFLSDRLAALDAEKIIIVPFMTSNGYVTTNLMPKALGPAMDDPRVSFTDAIGTHPMIAQAVGAQVTSHLFGANVAPVDAHLLMIGHGTRRNPTNEQTTRKFMSNVQTHLPKGVTADVAFLEHAPLLSNWATRTDRRTIFAVPFLMAGGEHGRVDVPEGLGLNPNSACVAPLLHGAASIGPCTLQGRKVWLMRAIGFDPVMSDAIEDRALQALAAESVAA